MKIKIKYDKNKYLLKSYSKYLNNIKKLYLNSRGTNEFNYLVNQINLKIQEKDINLVLRISMDASIVDSSRIVKDREVLINEFKNNIDYDIHPMFDYKGIKTSLRFLLEDLSKVDVGVTYLIKTDRAYFSSILVNFVNIQVEKRIIHPEIFITDKNYIHFKIITDFLIKKNYLIKISKKGY